MCTYCETFNFPAYDHRYNGSSTSAEGKTYMVMNFIAPKLSVSIVVGQACGKFTQNWTEGS